MRIVTTLTALFDTWCEAEGAETSLTQRGIAPENVTLLQDTAQGLSLPAEERAAYDEGLRRGGILLLARVEAGEVEAMTLLLETAGAVELDRREQDWRAAGWTGGTAIHTPGLDQAIPVVEERLVIGKRDVAHRTVRVRVHVHEVQVEVPVHLREEHAVVERRKMDRPATPADAFQGRVLEVETKVEEPVVAKEVVVVEKVVLHKEVAEGLETVRDTVRHTELAADGDPVSQSAPGTDRAGR